jgi:uncharacterized protein YhhL (DUF1145 family)
MGPEPMKEKLNDEEYQAIINVFSAQEVNLRRTAHQDLAFRVSFYFANIYAATLISAFYIISSFLTDQINPIFLEHQYLNLLEKRIFMFFWLLGAFNMSFYFGYGFRLVASVILTYIIYINFEQAVVIHGTLRFSDTPIFLAYVISLPFFIFAALGTIVFYRDN